MTNPTDPRPTSIISVGKKSGLGEEASQPECRELVKQIAADVGDAVVLHSESMDQSAYADAPSTSPISVRNTVFNEIMAAIAVLP